MKASLLIPTVFATIGSLLIIFKASPKTVLETRIAKSKDRTSTSNRLSEIGLDSALDFDKFRTKQIVYTASTGFICLLFSIFLRVSPVSALLFAIFASVLAFVAIDRDLSQKVKKQRLMIDSEFPAVIEMYSLALSAGETPLVAMERISKSAKGSLAKDFSIVVAQVKSGKAFHIALDDMGRRTESLLIRKFIDSLIIATLRGAPITEVLQRLAQEAREAQRNRVMGAAAKAEISMMVPVVFLILPISILFALWPSLANLNLIAGA
jgi:tight adherence protein C